MSWYALDPGSTPRRSVTALYALEQGQCLSALEVLGPNHARAASRCVLSLNLRHGRTMRSWQEPGSFAWILCVVHLSRFAGKSVLRRSWCSSRQVALVNAMYKYHVL